MFARYFIASTLLLLMAPYAAASAMRYAFAAELLLLPLMLDYMPLLSYYMAHAARFVFTRHTPCRAAIAMRHLLFRYAFFAA